MDDASVVRALVFAILLVLTAASSRAVGPLQLGATYDERGGEHYVSRSLAASCSGLRFIFMRSRSGQPEKVSFEMSRDSATNIWTKTVSIAELRAAGVTGTVYYGYRAWGPNWPFDPAWRKGTLIGREERRGRARPPLQSEQAAAGSLRARGVSRSRTPQHGDDAIFFTGSHAAADTGERAPKGIVLKPSPRHGGAKPTRPFKDEIIYEVHLRGLTMNDPSIPEQSAGTYAGAARKAAYLKSRSASRPSSFYRCRSFKTITTTSSPASTRGDNYWGYDPYNYFAPDRRYACG